jgi:hypothetical protein
MEAETGLPPETLGLILARRNAAAALGLHADRLPSEPRIRAILLDEESLASAIGTRFDSLSIQTARSLVVLAASAMKVPAILVPAASVDAAQSERNARRDGFSALALPIP